MMKLLLSLTLILPVFLAAQPVDSLKLLVETIECPKGWVMEFELEKDGELVFREFQVGKLTFVYEEYEVRYLMIKESGVDIAALDSTQQRYNAITSCRPSTLFYSFSKDGYRFISQMCSKCDSQGGRGKPCMKLSEAMREWAHKDN